jgi:NADP-dependent 3-hydroxy acid dehydrogenase YdfG
VTNCRTTLITGGSSGIGAAIARRLLARGDCVAVTARGSERLERVAEDAPDPDKVLMVTGDASDADTVEHAVRSTIERFGRLDVAVANAGFATHDSVGAGDPAGWRDMVLTNVLGPALLIRAALEHLKATRGRIVLVGSVAGLAYTSGNIYGATKWAVTGLAENTRRMVTGDGIGVTLIAPGRVETGFWEPVGGAPDGRNLTPDELAGSILWAIDQPEGVDVNTVVVRPFGAAV